MRQSPSRAARLVALAVGTVGMCAVWYLLPEVAALRLLTGSILVVVLPGYAARMALVGTARSRLEEAAWIIVLSVVTNILAGVALHASPWGLRTHATMAVLAATTLGLVALAALRPSPIQRDRGPVRLVLPPLPQLLSLLAATTLTVLALAMAWDSASRAQQPQFTQLWALPSSRGRQAVSVGITNLESRPMEYELYIVVDGRAIVERRSVALAAGETFEAEVSLGTTGYEGVTVLLCLADQPGSVYRWVRLNAKRPL